MEKLKKIEIEIDENGYCCKYFKINGKEYGIGIESVDITIINEKPPVHIHINGRKKLMSEDINNIENVDISDTE